MSGKKIGYIRVSDLDQNHERQLEGVILNKKYIDKASGKDTNRPQLLAMIDYVRDGDTVTVHSMDRLARNLDDLRRLVTDITAKEARIEFIKEGLIFTGEDAPMSKLLLSVMGAFAELGFRRYKPKNVKIFNSSKKCVRGSRVIRDNV